MTDLNILQVLRAPTGGLWRHVVDLSMALHARGHHVGLVCDSGFSDPQTEDGLAQLSPHLSLGVHRIPIAREPGPTDPLAILTLRRLSRDLGIDIAHGHGAKGGLFARLARLGQPDTAAIYTLHGGTLNYPKTSVRGKLYRQVERWLLPITDAIVFESRFAHDAFCEQITPPTCLAPVIHNGLKPEEFAPLPAPADGYDFAFVGELRHIKGLHFLIEALVDVQAPDGRPATLIVAGDGPDAAVIRQRIGELGLDARVDLVGVQKARDVFARGRCVVIPSLAESLPYVVLEAAAAGKQVLTTRVGGIAEIFGPTADRLLPAGDTAALAKAMQAFMDDPQAAEAEIGTRYDFIASRFSVGKMADDIAALYAEARARRTG